MTTLRELENLRPSMVRNSLLTTSVGSSSSPSGPGEPSGRPLAPSRIDGQMTEWKTTLSLPMKYRPVASGDQNGRQASGSPVRRAH